VEIAAGVHAVQLRGCTGFLLAEERLSLIDAGLQGSRRPLERYLRGIGRDIDELDRIICTHGHPDHIGGVRELVAAAGEAEVLIHPADLEGVGIGLQDVLRIRKRGSILHFLTPHPGAALPIVDGDVIPALGGLEVIHTPGHTPGSVCLWAQRYRLLFVGDALQVRRGRLTYASAFFSHDYPAARTAVARLAELDVETIALAHYAPWQLNSQARLRALAGKAAV
jgi:glyoxylase-like metal-dependent hydrolase (beta-lactamase superfamily II)